MRNVSPVFDSIFNLNNLEIYFVLIQILNLTLFDEAARVGTSVAAGRGVVFDHLLLLL